MITLEPCDRYTVKQILNHDWMHEEECPSNLPCLDNHIMQTNRTSPLMNNRTIRSISVGQQVSKEEVKQVFDKLLKAGVRCNLNDVEGCLIKQLNTLNDFSATCNLLLVSVRRQNKRKI